MNYAPGRLDSRELYDAQKCEGPPFLRASFFYGVGGPAMNAGWRLDHPEDVHRRE